MTKSKSNEILTPYNAFTKMNDALDKALEHLDIASEFFTLSVISTEYENEIPDETKREEYIKEVKGYTLMMDHLINHPLITVVKQMRDEAKVHIGDTAILALNHSVEVGQVYRHYKGNNYRVIAVSKDSNYPVITYITYTPVDQPTNGEPNPTWTLPIAEFALLVDYDGGKVNRFQKIA